MALPQEIIDQLNRMDFWIRALLPESTDRDVYWESHGYSLSREEYDAALGDFLGEREPTPELVSQFHEALEEQFLLLLFLEKGHLEDSERFLGKARVAFRRQMSELVIEKLLGDWEPSQEELHALYDSRRSEFSQPERIRVRIILVEGSEEAEEVLSLLEGGSDFRQTAMERSIHESRVDGGELEEFQRGTFNEAFESLAFSLEPGERDKVTTGAGTFIIEKVSHIADSYTPFEQVRPLLLRELQDQRREAILFDIRRRISPQP